MFLGVKTNAYFNSVLSRYSMDVVQFGDMRGFWGVFHAGLSQLRLKLGITPEKEGVGTANTALVFHANKLLALHEGDLPYAVHPSSLPSWGNHCRQLEFFSMVFLCLVDCV